MNKLVFTSFNSIPKKHELWSYRFALVERVLFSFGMDLASLVSMFRRPVALVDAIGVNSAMLCSPQKVRKTSKINSQFISKSTIHRNSVLAASIPTSLAMPLRATF